MSAVDPLFLDPDNVEPEDIDRLIEATAMLPPAQRAHAIASLRALIRTTHIQKSKDSYYHFASTQMPGFRHGRHIRLLAAQLDRVIRGECKRLIVAMPPRHSKSQNVSKYFPAYFLGHHPDAQILSVSHTGALAVNFGREVRDIISTATYQDVFQTTKLKSDVKAAGEWQTDAGGAYYAAGVGANIAGRGAHLLLCDDLVAEQEALHGISRPEVFEKIFEWYLLARQRLMPGGAIVLCATRWAPYDPTGLILERSNEDWEVLELPAMDEEENILWPEFWQKDEIVAIRDELLKSAPLRWYATYQQAPQDGGTTLVDRAWLKDYPHIDPPRSVKELTITVDPAFTDDAANDPTGIVVSALWERTRTEQELADAALIDPDDNAPTERVCLVLDAIETWQSFPDLKATLYELYRRWRPTTMLVENKASGISLVQELNNVGIPATLYRVNRGAGTQRNDKIARLSAVLPLIKAGRLHIPSLYDWGDNLRTLLCKFPAGRDDLVDAMVMALTHYRNLGGLDTPLDNKALDITPDDGDNDGDASPAASYAFSGYGVVKR